MGKYLKKFKDDVKTSVESLIDFDKTLLSTTLGQLTSLQKKMDGVNQSAFNSIKTCIQGIENIKDNASLKGKYQQIYNSCLVLLVAFFSSALRDIFSEQINKRVNMGDENTRLRTEKITIRIEDLKKYDFNLKNNIGSIITEFLNVSFQDMQATSRTFETYLDIQIPRNRTQNNIITGQAARHVIVHSDGRINNQFLNQVREISDRDFLNGVKKDDVINFTEDDIRKMMTEMGLYIEELEKLIA